MTDVTDRISQDHLRERVRGLLETLPPREAEILRLRFGVDRDEEGLTLAEIGEKFSVSRERVRQLEAEALAKLGGSAAVEELDSHFNR